MPKPTGDETARHYAAAHARLAELVVGLTPAQLATPVSSTPGWTVHDVVAHLTAIPTEAMAGRLAGIPSDEQTHAHVEERRDRTHDELLAEWTPNVEPMCEGARAGLVPPNLAVDALTHEQDIRGALRLEPALTRDELRFCTNLYAFGFSYAVKKQALPALDIAATDTDFTRIAGEGEPQASLRASEFELFRALSGRRGRSQVLAYDWTGDPAPYLGLLNVFGSLPEGELIDA
jgi:uncharacterized protein (TIGR03083 family)